MSYVLSEGEITFSWANPEGTVAVLAEVWPDQSGSFTRAADETDLSAPFMSLISYAPAEAGSYLLEVLTSTNGTCSSLYSHPTAVAVAEHQLQCPKPDQPRHDSGGQSDVQGGCHDPIDCVEDGIYVVGHDHCHAVICPSPLHHHDQNICHDRHTCPKGKHLDGHDSCHKDHDCPDGSKIDYSWHPHGDCEFSDDWLGDFLAKAASVVADVGAKAVDVAVEYASVAVSEVWEWTCDNRVAIASYAGSGIGLAIGAAFTGASITVGGVTVVVTASAANSMGAIVGAAASVKIGNELEGWCT